MLTTDKSVDSIRFLMRLISQFQAPVFNMTELVEWTSMMGICTFTGISQGSESTRLMVVWWIHLITKPVHT